MKLVLAIMLYLLSPAPNRELYKDAEKREALARLYVEAGEKYGVDPVLLTYWSFRESSFRTGVVSKSELKEFGLFQVHGVTKFICRNELKTFGETLETSRGQIMCGAFLIRRYIDFCGSVRGALGKYANGRCGYARKDVNERLDKIECLRSKFMTGNEQTRDVK